MALIPFNAEGGFSVGTDEISTIISTTGNVTPTNLTVSGKTDLGPASNVTITGGSSGQVLTTDGSGNLSFTTPASAGGSLYVYTRTSEVVYIEVVLGSIVIVGRSGNISIPIQA